MDLLASSGGFKEKRVHEHAQRPLFWHWRLCVSYCPSQVLRGPAGIVILLWNAAVELGVGVSEPVAGGVSPVRPHVACWGDAFLDGVPEPAFSLGPPVAIPGQGGGAGSVFFRARNEHS